MSIGYLFSSRHQRLLKSQQVLKLSPLLLHHWRCHRWLIHLCIGSKPACGLQYTSKFYSLQPHNLHLSHFLGCLFSRTNCPQALHDWSTEVSGANSLAVYLSSAMEGCREEDLLAPANWISAGGVGYCCRQLVYGLSDTCNVKWLRLQAAIKLHRVSKTSTRFLIDCRT